MLTSTLYAAALAMVVLAGVRSTESTLHNRYKMVVASKSDDAKKPRRQLPPPPQRKRIQPAPFKAAPSTLPAPTVSCGRRETHSDTSFFKRMRKATLPVKVAPATCARSEYAPMPIPDEALQPYRDARREVGGTLMASSPLAWIGGGTCDCMAGSNSTESGWLNDKL